MRPRESGRAPAHARMDPFPPLAPRPVVPADALLDTTPMPRILDRVRARRAEAVVHVLPPETPPTGLRKFDLGTVPASVTPPRSWRKAAWFAVGTSAAVMVGLAYAAVEFVAPDGEQPTTLDAMPAYPTQPMVIEQLPAQRSSETPPDGTTSEEPRSSSPVPSSEQPASQVPVDTTDASATPAPSGTSPGTGAPTTPTAPAAPDRTTVGPAPVTPTSPQAMGDRTEQYFRLVTDDPEAAHQMTTGGMAREGAEGIEARYAGVERVQVQEMTIDRNQAITTSTVKIVRADGTETVERRQLTFTWGGDPKITDESATA